MKWTERRLFLLATVGVLVLLAAMTWDAERVAEDGLLAGPGWKYLQGVFLTILIFAIFTLGLSLEFGFTGLINFGHVGFLAIGAYTAAILTWATATPRGGAAIVIVEALQLPSLPAASFLFAILYVVIIVAIATAVAVGVSLVLGIPTLRLREDYLAIVTIGAAEIVRLIFHNQTRLANGSQGIFATIPGRNWVTNDESLGGFAFWFIGVEKYTGIDFNPYHFWLTIWALVALALGYWLVERLVRSPWGRVVRAIREDEDVAASLGKNVFAYKLQSLAVGSALAAVGGVFYAWFYGHVTPDSFLPIVTFYAWIMLVVGGVGNHRGAIAGAFVFWGIFEGARQLPGFLADVLPDASAPIREPLTEWIELLFTGPGQVALIGLVLVLVMMVRPQGALGRREEMLFGK